MISSAEQISFAEGNIYGGVAQLGEHLPCKQGVMGSNPIISTTAKAEIKENQVKRINFAFCILHFAFRYAGS